MCGNDKVNQTGPNSSLLTCSPLKKPKTRMKYPVHQTNHRRQTLNSRILFGAQLIHLCYVTLLLLLNLVLFTHADCSVSKNHERLDCRNLSVVGNSEEKLRFILNSFSVKQIKYVGIFQSKISTLNLDSLSGFSSLEKVEVFGSNVKFLTGSLSHFPQLQCLNMSSNILTSLDESVFQSGAGNVALSMDLSNNKLSFLPNSTFNFNLKSVRLKGNQFNCTWVMSSRFYKWYATTGKFNSILEEPDETTCQLNEEVFQGLSFLGALKVKENATEECKRITSLTPGCQCNFRTVFPRNKLPHKDYPVVHTNSEGNVSYSLNMSCINADLEHLPNISPFILDLVVANNRISDLSPLTTDPDYKNLIGLNASYNLISTLSDLSDSPFFSQFQFLYLDGNNISEINEIDIVRFFARSIDNDNDIEYIGLGENVISCDCDTATKLKPTLVKHEKVIRDWKSIYCKSPNMTIWDLKYYDVCKSTVIESEEVHWFIIIIIEVVLILFVIIKVWHDQREFRRSGSLPLCSTWIPRLPCDFMLEGLKDAHPHPNGGHNKA